MLTDDDEEEGEEEGEEWHIGFECSVLGPAFNKRTCKWNVHSLGNLGVRWRSTTEHTAQGLISMSGWTFSAGQLRGKESEARSF